MNLTDITERLRTQDNRITENPEAGIKMVGCRDVSIGANEMETPVTRTRPRSDRADVPPPVLRSGRVAVGPASHNQP